MNIIILHAPKCHIPPNTFGKSSIFVSYDMELEDITEDFRIIRVCTDYYSLRNDEMIDFSKYNFAKTQIIYLSPGCFKNIHNVVFSSK